MLILKGVLFIGIVFASAHGNTTIPTTTIGFIKENVNNTNKMGVVALSNAANDTATTIGLTNVSSVTPSNELKIINITKIPSEKRRAIVTINSPSVLRQAKRKRKGKGRKKSHDPTLAEVESLLYEEYESDGTKTVEYMMYTMEDVSKFFSGYLHTEICHVRCPPTPAEIAREEEAKKAAAAAAKTA